MEDPDLDIESQSSGGAYPSGQGRRGRTLAPSEAVYANLTSEAKALWIRERGTVPLPYSAPFHAHGFLAASRFVLEKQAMEEALQIPDARICDVGGCPKRNEKVLGDRGWYVMPQLQKGDARRLRETPTSVKRAGRLCHCRLEDCTHLTEDHVLVFVHSAYYIDAEKLWHLVKKAKACYVVGHVFEGAYGGLLQECTWEVDDGVVKMAVHGNHEPYQHNLLPWDAGWRGPSGECFIADELGRVGPFTRLWEIQCGTAQKPAVLEFSRVLIPEPYTGPVQFSDSSRIKSAAFGRSNGFSLDIDHVYRIGRVFVTDSLVNGTRRKVTVPVDLVGEAAAFMSGKPRDPTSWLNTRHHVAARAAKMNVPVSRRAEVITVSTALGFTLGLETEVDVLHTVQSRYGEWFRFHSDLLTFQNPKVWKCWGMVGVLLVATLTWLSIEALDDDAKVRAGAAMVYVCAMTVVLCCLVFLRQIARGAAMSAAEGWNLSMRGTEPSSPLSMMAVPLLGNTGRVPGTSFVPPPPDECAGKIELDPPRDRYEEVRNAEVPRLLAGGIVFQDAAPTAFATTQAVEESAVLHRILRPKGELDAVAADAFGDWMAKTDLLPEEVVVDLGKNAYHAWVQGLKKSYNKTYVELMLSQWPAIEASTPGVVTPGRPFLKLEKGYTVGAGGGVPSKPRLIQPPVEPLTKAVTGFVSSQMYRAVAQRWNGIDCPIFYCSGVTTDHIGRVVDDFLLLHPDAIVYKNDFSGYDASLSIALQHPVFKRYGKMGAPDWALSHFTAVRTRGQTPTGVRFYPERRQHFDDEAVAIKFAKKYLDPYGLPHRWDSKFRVLIYEDFQMCSGRGDTNLCDTIINAATYACHFDDVKVPWLLLVNGDDSLLLTTEDGRGLVDKVIRTQAELGLISDGAWCANRSDWEFCSKLFWYGVDPKTRLAQTVLGPKVGRAISRMGMNTTVAGTQNVAAAALSVRRDASHVPFVRVLAERTYQICAKEKIKPVGHEEYGLRSSKAFELDARNWSMCEDRYGLDLRSETHFADLLAEVSTVPVALSWPPLSELVVKDD